MTINSRGKSDKEKTIKFSKLYKMVKEQGLIRSHNGELLLCDEVNQFYKRLKNPLSEINALIPIEYRDAVSPSIVELIYKKLKMDKSIELDASIVNPVDYIHVRNGLVHIPTLQLLEKDIKKYAFNYMMPVDFLTDEELKIAPRENFLNFLKTTFADNKEQKELLLSALGYLLTDYTQARVGIFLIGPTACGKSVICKIMVELIGKDNVSCLSLNELGAKFNVSLLRDSKINISTELNCEELPYSGILKAVISSDDVFGDVKFEKGVSFTCKAKILQASNVIPLLKNDSDSEGAFRDRMVVVNFPKEIEVSERDPYLLDKLKGELSFIFSICIRKFKCNVYDNEFKFRMPKENIALINSHCMSTNEKIRSFISDDCVVEEGAKEHTFMLYNAFKKYCEESLLGKVCEQNEFTNILIQEGEKQGIFKSKFRKNGKNRVGFVNIALKEK